MMRRITLLLVVVGTMAGVVGVRAPASGHADQDAAAIFVTKIPPGYRDWKFWNSGLRVPSRKRPESRRMASTGGRAIALTRSLWETCEEKAMSKLEWKLLTKKRGSATQGVPPGKEDLAWVTNTVTLLYGQRDAVLVDTFLTEQQSKELVDWVVESGKNLSTIYITHAHGDHFFGLKHLLDKFPNAKAIATSSVVAAIQDPIKQKYLRSVWEQRFPGQLPSQVVVPEVLEGDTFYLEDEEIKVVKLGHTDTSHSTALYVPAIGLVVSGDCVYNNTHLYLAECNEEAMNEWLVALDKIASLDPQAVVAGHGVLDPDSSPRHIEETRGYLRDFLDSLTSTSTAVALYETMLSLHPDRVNPGSLWAASKTAKPF